MTMKSFITACLLLGSLAVSIQPASAGHQYDNGSFHGFIESQNINPGVINNFNNNHQKRWPALAEQATISKAQAIEIARQRTNGKILSAKLIRREQHSFYKIKVLTDQGRIKTLRINANR